MRRPGVDRKPRQAYSARQLERLEDEFKVSLTDPSLTAIPSGLDKKHMVSSHCSTVDDTCFFSLLEAMASTVHIRVCYSQNNLGPLRPISKLLFPLHGINSN